MNPTPHSEKRSWISARSLPLYQTETGAPVVAEEDGAVVGYAYLDAYNERSAYRYTADLSIYLAHSCMGRGVGSQLLTAIEHEGEKMGLHSIVAIITEENARSIAAAARAIPSNGRAVCQCGSTTGIR